MTKSQLRALIKEEIARMIKLNENEVYVSAEFEEIDGAIETIMDNMEVAYTDQIMVRKFQAMLKQLADYNAQVGTQSR